MEGQMQFNLFDAVREEFVIPENHLDLGTTNVEIHRFRSEKDRELVNRFLKEYHYLHAGDSGLAVMTRAYGCYIGGELASVVCYNPPGSRTIPEYLFGSAEDTRRFRVGTLALSRMVTHPDAPFNTTGYLFANSLKYLWEDNGERREVNKEVYRTVITFSDTLFHRGSTYMAINAWYAGKTSGGSLGGFCNLETGAVISSRQGKRTLTLKDCPDGFLPFRASDKLRYLLFPGSKNDQLETMSRLARNVKFACKVDGFTILKEGRSVRLSDIPSYENVYHLSGRRGTKRAEMSYIDYIRQNNLLVI